jgi:hypothetical protein
MSRASCGRSVLNSARQCLNLRCCARELAAGGGRCRRSGCGAYARGGPLLGLTWLNGFGENAQTSPPGDSCESLASVLVAKGTPLSVRMRLGRPNSLNRRVKTGLACWAAVDESAWHPNRHRL